MASADILGAFRDSFLSEYWQQKPLLLRSAFPGGLSALDADELAGLACSEGVESRLVIEKGARPWETRHGPFDAEDFSALPPTHWTLLVQAVDRLLPEVSALRQHFSFLPNWRVDDVMISYAPDQGSVGPHTDNYDVFLIQGQGRRRWDIGRRPLIRPELIADIDMKILAKFEAEESYVLEPGDMLYLPPGVPHHGVAIGESLTYSMGFRAPQHREMLLSYLQFLLEATASEDEIFYRDQGIRARSEPGLLLEQELTGLWQLMEEGWNRPELFKRWAGSFLTEPRSYHEAPATELNRAQLLKLFKKEGTWRRAEGGRCSYYRDEAQAKLYFYVEGQTLELAPAYESLLAYLSREEFYKASDLEPWLREAGAGDLLVHLWNLGFIRKDD